MKKQESELHLEGRQLSLKMQRKINWSNSSNNDDLREVGDV